MKTNSVDTNCVHAGEQTDKYQSANTPVYTSTAFGYLDAETLLYPRYLNTPNQQVLIDKLNALEGSEAGLILSSGMAAISSVLLGLLNKGDHIIFQKGLYGGTLNFIRQDLERFGIEYTTLEENLAQAFTTAIRPHTKAIYIETPANPLLSIVDIAMVSEICRKNKLVSIIDNTFASPINQNPIGLGIDVVIHSATKYLGGHSDITAGAILSSHSHIDKIKKTALSLGGSLDSMTCYLLERSIKTLKVRVEKQNANALKIAEALSEHSAISKVFYPGLASHKGHEIARKQMSGYGGMLSFVLKDRQATEFMRKLELIMPAASLGGVESTICDPASTSHRLLSKEQRLHDGIDDNLLRLSVGIEDANDLLADLYNAMK